MDDKVYIQKVKDFFQKMGGKQILSGYSYIQNPISFENEIMLYLNEITYKFRYNLILKKIVLFEVTDEIPSNRILPIMVIGNIQTNNYGYFLFTLTNPVVGDLTPILSVTQTDKLIVHFEDTFLF